MPTSLDDYVRRLDEKIAELEREEAEEKARLEKEKKEKEEKVVEKETVREIIKEDSSKTKTEEEIQKQIADILEHKYQPEQKEEKPSLPEENKFVMDDIVEEKKESFTQQPTYEEIEKPKVNVDVDSVIVDNKKPVTDDDFFDDFFGTEDE